MSQGMEGLSICVTNGESTATSKPKMVHRRMRSKVVNTAIGAKTRAVGMVNDHLVNCFRYREIRKN